MKTAKVCSFQDAEKCIAIILQNTWPENCCLVEVCIHKKTRLKLLKLIGFDAIAINLVKYFFITTESDDDL